MLILLAIAAPVAAYAAATALGALRWNAQTRHLRAALHAARVPRPAATVDFGELEGLPAPVQRYFRRVLTDGMAVVAAVSARHRGTFNMGTGAPHWKPFTSDQLVVTARPGFDWDGRIAVAPGVAVRVHDAYVGGEGILHAALLGLFTVADMPSTAELARGELMRFLAEAAWYPTALLPSQGVAWSAIDERSASATMTDGPHALTLLFRFNDEGLVDTVQADARGRTVGKEVVPTRWQGRFWNYQQRGGMLVPLEGEVAWLLEDAEQPYWRGELTSIAYELAGQAII